MYGSECRIVSAENMRLLQRRIALNDAETNALASVCDNAVKTSRFPCANPPYAHEFQGMKSMRLPLESTVRSSGIRGAISFSRACSNNSAGRQICTPATHSPHPSSPPLLPREHPPCRSPSLPSLSGTPLVPNSSGCSHGSEPLAHQGTVDPQISRDTAVTAEVKMACGKPENPFD